MENTISTANYYILNKNFETVYSVDQYESLLWVERYYECGDFEIICPPNQDVIEYASVGNYLMSSESPILMIFEKITITTSAEEGVRYKLEGRSLESILDRRVILHKTLIKNNLEDAIRQLLDVSFIKPSDSGRKIDIFEFQYSYDPRINSITCDYEFDKGTSVLEVIQTMCQNAGCGFKMILTDDHKFSFALVFGDDHTYDQDVNPWIVFSPNFNNLISDKYEKDAGEKYKNLIYVEGEVYNNQDPQQVIIGTATGLERREYFEDASDINHKVTDLETGEEITLTASEYTAQLKQRGNNIFSEKDYVTTVESEVEPRLVAVYREDYYIGDIVQVENILGFETKSRVTEFIIQHDSAGLQMYPKFTGLNTTANT